MTLPNFYFENILHKKGYRIVAGVDEVGRGCFAGPVVTGCVVFNKQICKSANKQSLANQIGKQINEWVAEAGGVPLSARSDCEESRTGRASDRTHSVSRHPSVLINDSKKLTPKQREIADKWIRKNALAWGIGSASVSQINKLGIKKASEIAFRKAIKDCGIEINYLLIDAFYIPYVKNLRRKNQKPIIKGDTKSISIAGASIIAKVYRDKLMTDLSKKPKFRKYKWGKNKGYGTLEHRKAIKKYGSTRQHRKQFVETWLLRSTSH